MGNLVSDNRRTGIAYEDYEKVVPCSQLIPGSGSPSSLSRLAGRRETVRNPDGSVSTGTWRWWYSDSCRDPELDRLREKASMARMMAGGEPLPKCPEPDIPGVTCRPIFYPETTDYPDGSHREQAWSWNPASGEGRAERHHQVELWNVHFTPDEWTIYQLLSDDAFLRKLDPGMAVAIYYSVLQWRCTGEIAPRLDPSPISPQSLKGKFDDSGVQHWLEFWERGVRDRLWQIRTDLRTITLPDGTAAVGLRDPKAVEVRPSCTSSTGKIIMTVFSAVTSIAGLALSWPSWVSLLWQVPISLDEFRQQLKLGSFIRKAGGSISAAQQGSPTGPQAPPTTQETQRPAPADPTGLQARAEGLPAPTVRTSPSGWLIPLLIAGAVALLG